MLILGIDVGPRLSGWAILRLDAGLRPLWLAGGHHDWDHLDEARQEHGCRTVVIERPVGYVHEHKRGKELLDTAWVGGMLFGWYQGNDVDTYVTHAEEWRGIVCGKPGANDEQVEMALRLRMVLPKRSSVHARDAAGAALGVAMARGWLVNGKGRLDAKGARA